MCCIYGVAKDESNLSGLIIKKRIYGVRVMKKSCLLGALCVILLTSGVGQASIISVVEVNLGGDDAAIIEPSGTGADGTLFGEDVNAFSDRIHEHNGAAFDSTGTLSTSGTTVVPLPSYLVGNEYVRFSNNAEDNADYVATIIADEQLYWYLLVDNRLDGLLGDASSSNTTDPVLGGTLEWVTLGNWLRVDTGISPNGQADYTGVDEGGDGTGPGVGLDQFYSVYRLSTNEGLALKTNLATVFNNGIGITNMIAVVGSPSLTPIPIPAAVWLFASGLIGLVGIARRKKTA